MVLKKFKSKYIFFSGLISLIFYSAISFILNSYEYLDSRYLLIFLPLLSLFVVYFCSYIFLKDRNISKNDVIFFSVIFLIILIFTIPVTYTDFYHYFFEDLVFLKYHQNPYFVSPQGLPQEPLSFLSGWDFLPAQHGPLRVLMMSPVSWLSGFNITVGLFLYKIFFSIFFLASAFVFYKILDFTEEKKKDLALFLFLWNPLLLFSTLVRGGTDILMVFWLLLAALFIFKDKFYLATLFLALSASLKFVTIIFLPFFLVYYLRKVKWFSLLNHLLLFGLIMVILFIPFWAGLETLNGLIWVASFFDINSLPGFIGLIANFINGSFEISFVKIFFQIGFVASYGFLLYHFYLMKNKRPVDLVIYMAMALIAFLLLYKVWFFVKYFIWLLPLLLLGNTRSKELAIFFTGSVALGAFSSVLLVFLFTPGVLAFSFYHYLKK